MTTRVINDPSALGWEYDPDTGRWTWGGGGGGSNGGGGSFPEAPVDGLQYGRQNASWTKIVSGGGGDVDLSDYYTMTESDAKFQVKGNYLTEFTEEDPTVPSHVKSITTSDINKWNNPPTGGGGGGAVDSVNGKTGTVVLNYTDVGAQVAGSYATASHNHNGVYQPVGNYATTSYSYSKAESDNKYEPKGGGGSSETLQSVTDRGATTTKNISAKNFHTTTAAYTLGGVSGSGARIIQNGNWAITGASGTLLTIQTDGKCLAVDFVASSDRNKKDNIETAKTGLIEQIRGVTFNWKDTGAEGSGVVAQELQEVGLGHLVHDSEDGLKVSYNGLTAYLIEEVKALRAEIEEMKR